jgi:putative ubiquitin-RnfH superfamily antitoxin RatB of RatAB toxin-antitoxin module
MSKRVVVEIAYASPTQQKIIAVEVELPCQVGEAIAQSGMLAHFTEIDLTTQAVGIFSKKCELTDMLKAGDRVEIYRPLTIDPKEARRAKAEKKAEGGR